MRTKCTFATLLFVCLTSLVATAQSYTITDLGSLQPTAINSWAQIVGSYNNQAYMWNFGHMTTLGLLSGGTFSHPVAINDLGVVTGTADGAGTVISPTPAYPNRQCDDLIQPFTWTRNAGIRGIGTLGSLVFLSIPGQLTPDAFWCGQDSYASDINARGRIIGYTGNYLQAYNLSQFGMYWDGAGNFTYFGGSWPPTFADAISNSGQIVGQNANISYFGLGHATSWKDGVATDLGTLRGGEVTIDFFSSAAKDVNDAGEIVGWSFTTSLFSGSGGDTGLGGDRHAVVWTPSGTITDLGTLPGDTLSMAKKINAFGVVIGSSGNAVVSDESSGYPRGDISGRPFIWSDRHGMNDLNMLIPRNSGWVLNTATDINVWGQIVGTGTRNEQPHGYLLTPKNPFQPY